MPCNFEAYGKVVEDYKAQRYVVEKYKLLPYSFRRTFCLAYRETMIAQGLPYGKNPYSKALNSQMGWKTSSKSLFTTYARNTKKVKVPKIVEVFANSLISMVSQAGDRKKLSTP